MMKDTLWAEGIDVGGEDRRVHSELSLHAWADKGAYELRCPAYGTNSPLGHVGALQKASDLAPHFQDVCYNKSHPT
jgi:hypothetical protein